MTDEDKALAAELAAREKAQDDFLAAKFAEEDGTPAPAAEAAAETPEATEDPAPEEPADDAEPAAAPEAAAPTKLSAEDEEFAFQWLARAGLQRAKINRLMDTDPELALDMARAQKKTQDTLARTRREVAAGKLDDYARPSDSARPQTGGPSPEELRRARIIQLVRDLGDEGDAQALEREYRPQQAESDAAGSGIDPRVLAAVSATRERLVLSGHDELRDEAKYGAVLKAADVLRAADPALGVGEAITEAAETLRIRDERRQAASQERRAELAGAQPSIPAQRTTPRRMSKAEAEHAHIVALESGDKARAAQICKQYSL